MSAVEVEIAEEAPSAGDGAEAPRGRRTQREASAEEHRDEPLGIEVEREVTKRQIIQSISTIVVVILYMVFTLLRDRDTGVIVVDPDESDDWDEG